MNLNQFELLWNMNLYPVKSWITFNYIETLINLNQLYPKIAITLIYEFETQLNFELPWKFKSVWITLKVWISITLRIQFRSPWNEHSNCLESWIWTDLNYFEMWICLLLKLKSVSIPGFNYIKLESIWISFNKSNHLETRN